MIGFLTSQRVLILSIDLEILSFYNYLSSFQTPLIGEASGLAAVSSIQFAGSALIYITLSGAVSYLIPSYSGTQESDNELMITEYFQNVCLRESQNNIVKTNILFKLPLKMSVTGSVKLSCIFSDRIVLMYNRNTARINDPHVHMTVRPVMLGEPILLSLISQSERSLTEDASIELFQTMIDSMRRYFDFRYLKDSNKSPPLSHLSNKLLVAVHSFLRRGKNTQTVATQSIFDELKLIFIDLLLNLDEDIVPPFPRAKWTLPGVSLLLASLHHKISSHSSDKAIIPKKGKTGATTSLVPFNVRVCAEFFINHRPDLVDILFEPSVHSGSGLLPPLSAVAKQCSAMSRVMLQEGLFEIARIFADFAGDDSLVFLAMICECSKMEENSYGKPSLVWIHDKIISRKGDFLQFKRSLVVDEDGSVAQAKIFYSLNILEDITKQLENGSHDDVIALMKSDLNVSISEIFSFTSNAPQREQYSSFEASTRTFVTVQSLCGNQNMRRAALQILTNGALDSRISWLAKDRVNEVSKKHIEMASKPMDSTSIVSSYYLMDAVEEWLCLRCFPELHSPSDLFSKVGKSQVTAHNILEDESRPSTWVEGVGAGKADWEKLAAYWRFSDPIGIKDELFISTGLPASRLCLPDLSKVSIIILVFIFIFRYTLFTIFLFM